MSFLCSAYRTEDTIVETIESVLAQTRGDWQLVVCDNGMNDAIATIVDRYTDDPRITMVRQENQFASGGVNAAARVARGRYVAVVHSDDLVLPSFVERLVSLLDAEPGTAALAPDARFLAGRGLRSETFRDPVPARYRTGAPVGFPELIDGWVPYYTALVRREVWEEVGGFRRDIPNVEDLGLWVDMIARGHVLRCVEEPLAVYREDENSDSRGARGVEVMEESWERVMVEAVASHGNAEEAAALKVALVRSRHRRATVRTRRLLLDGDFAGALAAAQEARHEQADPRTRVMVLALSVSPRSLRAAYQVKKSAERRLKRLAPHTAMSDVSAEQDRPRPGVV